MLIEITAESTDRDVGALVAAVAAHPDVTAWPVNLAGRRFIVVSGDEALVTAPAGPAVHAVHSTTTTGHWLVDRAHGVAPDQVRVGAGTVGRGAPFWCAAGPCALESVQDTRDTALRLRDQGVQALRMGLFKPRTSPYHFTGKGRGGLAGLAEIAGETGLPVVTEIMDPRDVAAVAAVAGCLQVDGRNMSNRVLLAELGSIDRPVLLMRGPRASVADWLRAAEFVFTHGNRRVVLCARGIYSFDDSLTFQPDYGAIRAARQRCDLPIIFDPSHSTGDRRAVAPAALAAAAFGADGLLLESYLYPERLYRPGDAAHMYPPDQVGRLLGACEAIRDLATTLV